MSRLSRAESQQLTRQRLIEAAEAEIIRVGIYEASIRRICDAAGYTLGAFYSNFKDKDELLLEVVELHTMRAFDVMKKVVTKIMASHKEEVLKHISKFLHELKKNAFLFGLSLEFEVYASHSEFFRKQYSKTKRKWHIELEKSLETLFAGQRLKPTIPLSQMAIGIAALWSGFVVEGSVSKTAHVDKVITSFIKALLESAESAND